MTERLADLLHSEADLLDVPPPPTGAVLSRGRGLRRRRRGAQLGGGLAALALVGGLVVAVTGGDDDRPALDPSTSPSAAAQPSDLGAVFAIGSEVYLTGPGVTADIDDVAVKSMYYTSVGVLVRHGDNNYSDGGGPQRYSLVTPDGTVKPIDVVTNEVVPGVDADQALLAYAEVNGGTVEVVVHDLTTDAEIARVPVPDAKKWGGWSAPPVALNGDEVYVGTDDVARVVDWRTGEVREDADITPGFPPEFFGGRIQVGSPTAQTVVEATTGETLLSIEQSRRSYVYLSLSPDGRYVTVNADGHFVGGEYVTPPTQVYDVDSGNNVDLPQTVEFFSWTPSGDLISLGDAGVLTTCSPATGECTTEQLELDILPNSLKGDENFDDDLVLGNEVREA